MRRVESRLVGAVLIDVGGTLWPDTWPRRPQDDREQAARLREAAPQLTDGEAATLVAALKDTRHPAGERQRTHELVVDALRTVTLSVDPRVSTVQHAMCLPARGRIEPFPGAAELLGGLSDRSVRVVIVSNVLWRDAHA